MAATFWMPDNPRLTGPQMVLLSVPSLYRPDPARYLELWSLKALVLAMVQTDPTLEVQRAVASQTESLSDQWLNLLDERLPTLPQLPLSLTQSDNLMDLRALIEWDEPGQQIEPPGMTFQQMLDLLS